METGYIFKEFFDRTLNNNNYDSRSDNRFLDNSERENYIFNSSINGIEDADLIFLCLSTNSDNMFLLREAQEFDKKLPVTENNYFNVLNENDIDLPKYVSLKLILSLVFLVFAAWLITFGANKILDEFSLGELFIGYTVLAIGTSLPEIAASVSLALKGRYETVTGTLIGSNIFNGLCVLAIPGLFMNPKMSLGWSYSEWSPLLFILFIITFIFACYIFSVSKKERYASILLSLLFLSSYFVSLYFAY